MQSPESLIDIRNEFKHTVGFRATAEISRNGALRSAGILIGIEERIATGTTAPIDLFSAVISTSQLLRFWEARQRAVSTGEFRTVEDTETISAIREKIATGPELNEIRRLTKLWYVADIPLGVRRGMATVRQLQERYPHIHLSSNES